MVLYARVHKNIVFDSMKEVTKKMSEEDGIQRELEIHFDGPANTCFLGVIMQYNHETKKATIHFDDIGILDIPCPDIKVLFSYDPRC